MYSCIHLCVELSLKLKGGWGVSERIIDLFQKILIVNIVSRFKKKIPESHHISFVYDTVL